MESSLQSKFYTRGPYEIWYDMDSVHVDHSSAYRETTSKKERKYQYHHQRSGNLHQVCIAVQMRWQRSSNCGASSRKLLPKSIGPASLFWSSVHPSNINTIRKVKQEVPSAHGSLRRTGHESNTPGQGHTSDRETTGLKSSMQTSTASVSELSRSQSSRLLSNRECLVSEIHWQW